MDALTFILGLLTVYAGAYLLILLLGVMVFMFIVYLAYRWLKSD